MGFHKKKLLSKAQSCLKMVFGPYFLKAYPHHYIVAKLQKLMTKSCSLVRGKGGR